jgi:hypothetical protein
MVSATDFPKTNGRAVKDEVPAPRKTGRFRLFSALAAPFRDLDERAIRRRGKHAQNTIIGAPFADYAPAPRPPVPVKPPSRRGG